MRRKFSSTSWIRITLGGKKKIFYIVKGEKKCVFSYKGFKKWLPAWVEAGIIIVVEILDPGRMGARGSR